MNVALRYLSVFLLAIGLGLPAPARAQDFDPADPETVVAVQEALIGLGYDPGPPDGQMGRNTRAAIKAFQKTQGLDETGEITVDLLGAFEAETARQVRDADIESIYAALKQGNAVRAEELFEKLGELGELRERGNFTLGLRRAISGGNISMVRLLAEQGFIEPANALSPPLLHLALERPRPRADIVRALVAHLEDLDPLDDKNRTPLVRALFQENIDVALVLIEAGADIRTRAAQDLTPLHFAAYKGALEAVERLLEKGADTSAIDGVFGLMPVEIAIRTQQWHTFDRLMQAGGSVA